MNKKNSKRTTRKNCKKNSYMKQEKMSKTKDVNFRIFFFNGNGMAEAEGLGGLK